MSVFSLPKKICKCIDPTMACFWWENNKKEKKIHWRNWTKLGESKSSGGLGFWDIEAFNKTLLA